MEIKGDLVMRFVYQDELHKLLALEFNCVPEDFRRAQAENVLSGSKLLEGRRVYSPEKYFFHMVTTGRNAVVTADECLHPFLSEYIKNPYPGAQNVTCAPSMGLARKTVTIPC